MSKRILLAEESNTIRDLAESLLRQNGMEVLSVTSGEKAIDVLNYARPDLIIMASEMKFRGHVPLYEHLQESSPSSTIPFLIMANQNEAGLPFPEEIIIPKPFNPKDFMDKVNSLTGSTKAPVQQQPESDALSELEDEMIDKAFGTESLNITDSEEMKTKETSKTTQIKRDAKILGIDDSASIRRNLVNTGKVESLMIRDEHGEIKQPDVKDKEEEENLSESNKLEILNDQFGLIDPIEPDSSLIKENHDYNWFLKELQKDDDIDSDTKQEKFKQPPIEKTDQENENLNFEETSSHITPVQPANVKIADKNSKPISSGVDSFIDEFKKEMEKISSSDEPETFTVEEDKTESKKNDDMKWQDSAEKIALDNIEAIKEKIASEVSDRITKNLLDQISSDELIEIMKKEIAKKSKKEE